LRDLSHQNAGFLHLPFSRSRFFDSPNDK
jgi:hypothetical protein